MYFLEEELADTRKKSAETVAETRCDTRRQSSEMEDKVYGSFEKSKDLRRASRQQAAEILTEEKEKVSEVRRLASKNMAEKMANMERKSAEVKR